MLGQVDASVIEDLKTGTGISSRACSNVLNPLLNIIDPLFVPQTCLGLAYATGQWDCSALYVQLASWAMVLDYQGVANNALAYPGFVANEDTVKYILLNANPVVSAPIFRQYVNERYVFLREGVDSNGVRYRPSFGWPGAAIA